MKNQSVVLNSKDLSKSFEVSIKDVRVLAVREGAYREKRASVSSIETTDSTNVGHAYGKDGEHLFDFAIDNDKRLSIVG
jgi:hypothetical protein